MPRFFFHTQDGHVERDDEGTELASIEEARREAARLMGEMLRASPGVFWDDTQLQVNVEDESGLLLFSVTTYATESAATQTLRRRTTRNNPG